MSHAARVVRKIKPESPPEFDRALCDPSRVQIGSTSLEAKDDDVSVFPDLQRKQVVTKGITKLCEMSRNSIFIATQVGDKYPAADNWRRDFR